nr:MAG TPA: hypothetical protein [Caudoviricetes sp.]
MPETAPGIFVFHATSHSRTLAPPLKICAPVH